MRRWLVRTVPHTFAVLVVVGAALAGSARPVRGQSADLVGGVPRRTVEAVRLADGERIILDGRLDEPVWRRAAPAADFIQIDPANGQPATEPTEVRLAYTREALYMGVTAYDSEPDAWLGFQRRRDEFLSADDRFMWRIDTFLDEQSGYFFEMNPSGLMADAVFGVNGMNRAWDGIWNARVRHSEIGWTLEIEIPFRTLNFDPDNDTWGINFQRTVRRKNEDSIWMGWARNQGLGRMTNAGRVTGIRDVTQGRGLDVKPYGLVSAEQGGPGSRVDRDAAAGLDLFYNVTPSLRANLTINTDFAQTEVDERQVNLTRFSLFFPERRDFFLDGATFFDFASTSEPGEQLQPFFSRRIGLGADAAPQRIDYGTKLTGQAGAYDVGFLHVRTGMETGAIGGEPLVGEEFTAARVRRRLFQQSYVGALYTRRDARGEGNGASQTLGVDFSLATATFRGDQNLRASGWFLTDRREDGPGDSSAYGVNLEYPNDRWAAGFGLREVGEHFDPSVGFVARRGYRRYNPSLLHGWRPSGGNHPVVRRVEFSSAAAWVTNLENELVERQISGNLFRAELQSQDNFGVDYEHTYVRLERPFPISRGITLPAGNEYDFTRLRVGGQTANRRTLAVTLLHEIGGFYSGDRRRTTFRLTVRAAPGYIVSWDSEWNRVDLAEGGFTSNVLRLVSDSQFTPFMALVNTFQFDTVTRVLGWQARYRWIITPGNDLYVVYTHNWQDDPIRERFETLNQKLASKILYTYRF